jgi:hypothetical protein
VRVDAVDRERHGSAAVVEIRRAVQVDALDLG